MSYLEKNSPRRDLREYEWRSGTILVEAVGDSNGGFGSGSHYRVLGWVNSSTDAGHVVSPLLKKEQRHCRAFLRGKRIDEKISFV